MLRFKVSSSKLSIMLTCLDFLSRHSIFKILIFYFFLIGILSSCKEKSLTYDGADLVIKNGKIWTGDKSSPWASWIAMKDEYIIGIGNENESIPEASRSIDIKGRLVVPGFNDSHVHFESAGALLLGINLLDVNDEEGLIREMKAATARLPKGSWITRGDWGAYEAWNIGSDGSETNTTIFTPHRSMIDDFTSDYPVLINRYDRTEGLANAAALKILGIESESGILTEEIFLDALKQVPEKSFERRLAESRRALAECRKYGVTTVQDMSGMDQVDVYRAIRKEGDLTCRINFAPSRLIEYENMAKMGWVINWNDMKNPTSSGDDWISFGTIKSHIDGIMGARTARFFQPYSDNILENASWRGGWREFSKDMPSFKNMILSADSAGIQLRIHAIGDQANSILLDILDTLDVVNGPRDRRFRLVHAQVIAPQDFDRFAGRNIIAEVQPYHVTDDMRWMEERIGYERCRGAYAFRTLKDYGCILSFGSDWPGTNASYYPINPLMGLYAAVTRQTINGQPENGWFPEQKITLEEALEAYTYGSSFGAFEESIKGTLEVGKLADLVVINKDLFSSPPHEWLEAAIDYTIVGGEVVYEQINED
jgi:predicted amidohydrolase YtcJ